jgi:conjugative transposon TraM protein
MKQHTEKFLRQRRFVMALPVLVTPFLILLFWALGGGQGTPADAAEQSPGFNLELPGAHFEKNEASLWDKFSLYEQATRDSIKYEEARRSDPYYAIDPLVTPDSVPGRDKLMISLGKKDHARHMREQEAIINKKLDELTRYVTTPPTSVQEQNTFPSEQPPRDASEELDQGAVDRLEKMMTIMSSSNEEDSEMKQIDQLLDKIIKIQHPEGVSQDVSSKEAAIGQVAHAVSPMPDEEDIEVGLVERGTWGPMDVSGDTTKSIAALVESVYAENAFYGIEDDLVADALSSNAMQAVVHETATVVTGATLKMRLVTDVMVGGRVAKKNAFVYGTCAIQGERLLITIKSIAVDNSILPTALSVYDVDGLEGIYIPGAITRDGAKQAASQSVQDVDLFSMDTSLGAQAAVAGVEAAKGLFSRKAKLIKVTVKAGYKIFLKDMNGRSS